MDENKTQSLPLILAVDDEAENLHLLEHVLSESYRLAFATDGDQAIRAIKKVRPDLVLLDIMMPGMDGFDVLDYIKRDETLCDTPVIFITSLDEKDDHDRGLSAGAVDYITKPFQGEEVLASIKKNLPLKSGNDAPQRTPGHLPLAETPLKILLVDDNEINSYLAVKSLKKFANEVTTVCDGKQCLAMLEDGDYDVVLMDVMMPEMDGYEATRLIRQREERNGGSRHIPIIALTAAAFDEDKTRCMEAGMDDYLTKPIDFALLMKKVRALTGISSAIEEKTAETTHVDDGAAALYDLTLLKEKLDGDEEKLKHLLSWFVSDTSEQIEAAEKCLTAGSAEQVVKSCHKIRGSAESIAAVELKSCAEEAEKAGKAGDMDDSRRKMAAVRESYEFIAEELEKEFGLKI